MHGVRRVKTTKELEEQKKKEELVKIEAYCKLNDKILEMKKNEEALEDEEVLDVSFSLLTKNPEFYSLWNMRRRFLLKLFSPDREQPDGEKVEKLMNKELELVVVCLKKNPKSYWVWLHRKWSCSLIDEKSSLPQYKDSLKPYDWEKELSLCEKLLALDSRNFHCWNYRRFVAQKCHLSHQLDLEFTEKKIVENFSNYSAWHQRTTTLKKIKEEQEMNSETGGEGFSEILKKELEFIQNAIYTSPEDQSAWLYHRWLISQVPDDLLGEILSSELEVYLDLLDLEPDSKWTLFGVFFMLEKQQLESTLKQRVEVLEKLKIVDKPP